MIGIDQQRSINKVLSVCSRNVTFLRTKIIYIPPFPTVFSLLLFSNFSQISPILRLLYVYTCNMWRVKFVKSQIFLESRNGQRSQRMVGQRLPEPVDNTTVVGQARPTRSNRHPPAVKSRTAPHTQTHRLLWPCAARTAIRRTAIRLDGSHMARLPGTGATNLYHTGSRTASRTAAEQQSSRVHIPW